MPIRAAVADMATNTNQRRPARLRASVFDCVCECVEVVGVLNRLGMPSVGFEPFAYVFGESDLGVAVDRDVIVVVQVDDVAKAQMARDRCRLARDALHHVAVAGDRENLMVEQAGAVAIEARRHVLGRDRHTHAVAEALAERTRRGFDAGGQMIFGMTGGFAAELAEAFDLVEREVVPGQVEHRIEQHRAMPGRQHEAVASVPVRIFRVMADEACEEQIGRRRHPHRHAGVTGVGLLHCVDREYANRVDAKLIEIRLGCFQIGCECHLTHRVLVN